MPENAQNSVESAPSLRVPHAVTGDEPDAGVPAHFGEPLKEQRALITENAIVDLSHRGVITVTGEDRLTWLNSLTSQKLDRLQPGQSAETLFLDANGRIAHAAAVLDDGVTTYLLLDLVDVSELLAWLESMRFSLRVEPRNATSAFATIGSMDNGSRHHVPVAQPNGVPLAWRDPWNKGTEGGYRYAHADSNTDSSWDWTLTLVDRTDAHRFYTTRTSSSPPIAGTMAMEALRIAAHRPRFATDVDAKTLPHELDWLRTAVHLNKGCYRGQETVAKVHNVGHPPRRLLLLHLDGSESVLPTHGDPVTLLSSSSAKAIGHVTSAALHHENGPIALALIKRTIDPTQTLVVTSNNTSITARQETIVPPDAGSVATIPRLERLGRPDRPLL